MTATATMNGQVLDLIERQWTIDSDLAKVLHYLIEEEGVDFEDVITDALETAKAEAEARDGRLTTAMREETIDTAIVDVLENYSFEEGRWGCPHVFDNKRQFATEERAYEYAEERLREQISEHESWFIHNVILPAWERGQSKDDYIENEMSNNMDNYLGENVETFDVGRTTYYIWDY